MRGPNAERMPTLPGRFSIVPETRNRASPSVTNRRMGAERRQQGGIDHTLRLGWRLPRRSPARSYLAVKGKSPLHRGRLHQPGAAGAGTYAMAGKLVSRAAPVAGRESSTASTAGENGCRLKSARSAPSSARAWSRTESCRLAVNELTATSAATPTRRTRQQGQPPRPRPGAPARPSRNTNPVRSCRGSRRPSGHQSAEWCDGRGRRDPGRESPGPGWSTSRFSSTIRSMMAAPVAASRFPVGSSANRTRDGC